LFMSILNQAQGKPKADIIVLTSIHLAERTEKIRQAASELGCSALVMFQPGNVAYISGLVLPFAEQYPDPRMAVILPMKESSPAIALLPTDWAQLPVQQNLNCRTVIVSSKSGLPPRGLLTILAGEISASCLEKSKIGLDMGQCNESILETLAQVLPGVELIDFGDQLNDMRMVKTDDEVNMLEEAVRQADRALVSAINHSEGCVLDTLSYSLWEFTERIRVHIGEFGGSAAGHLTTLQGGDMRIYSQSPQGNFVSGNLVRSEATSHHRGYWADTARTLFIGQAEEAVEHAYLDNIILKRTALQLMRPGIACSEVFKATLRSAQESGIDLWQEPGIGHGIGLSEREKPYLCPSDPTILQPGMVLVLAIYTFGPLRELICSKDTYVVTDDGVRLLSWYRSWEQLYCLKGNTARHG
jgi:Xaa-Pro dipeptidase